MLLNVSMGVDFILIKTKSKLELIFRLTQYWAEKFNAFNLLPEKFTMKDIQHIYEAIFQQKYIRSNFQKKILEMDVLERLEKKYTGAKNKAPYLYRLKG